MTSYHELETSTYTKTQAKPFTRIQVKPYWYATKKLIEEAKDVALECSVSYAWLRGRGLLAEVQGDVRYLAVTGLQCVEPTQPPNQYPGILPNTTQH